MRDLEQRLAKLEYHQSLLIQMLENNRLPFFRLVVKKNLDQNTVVELLEASEKMSIELEKQKAEGLILFTSLLEQWETMLPPHMNIMETVDAMADQGISVSLMDEFKKLLSKR